MSGSSLDGVDIALCNFSLKEKWIWEIRESVTVEYPESWKSTLEAATGYDGLELIQLHHEYGRYLGKLVSEFIGKTGTSPSLVASHGHTIFHQPEQRIGFQLGCGLHLALETGITTISDFRSPDIALGGQGAPLVPAGDHYLFPEYDYCLNLGGISNVSYASNAGRLAFDICPVNMAVNYLAGQLGEKMDAFGHLGAAGNIDNRLLEDLNKLEYYSLPPPKSLSREWFEKTFLPVLQHSGASLEDKFRSCYEHIAQQIAGILQAGKVLVTGGGAWNDFLMERIVHYASAECMIPNKKLVAFKESLLFAFLAVLRIRKEINCFASVTGASRDSSVGQIYEIISK